MLLPDWPFLHTTLAWLSLGLWDLAWWQIVLYTLVTTHTTIASVTIFLHRHQAHRALDLHAVPSHFFASGCGWARVWSPRNGWRSTVSTTPGVKPWTTPTVRRRMA